MKPCRKCSRPLSNRTSICPECGWSEPLSEDRLLLSQQPPSDELHQEYEPSSSVFVANWFISRAILLLVMMSLAGGVGWFCNGGSGATIGVFLGAILCAAGFLSEFAG